MEKVGLKDALDIADSGLSDDEYRYALMAHFDFVVTEGDDHDCLFAVEFDGPLHDTDANTIRRDRMKDDICARLGMPLLRLREEHIVDSPDRESILAWLVTVWFVEQRLRSATSLERLDYRLTAVTSKDGPDRVLALGSEGRRRIFDFLIEDADDLVTTDAGNGTKRSSVTIHFFPYTASDDDPQGAGEAVGYAFVQLRDGRAIVGQGRCRSVSFGPIGAGDVAAEMAIIDAAHRVEQLGLGRGDPAGLLTDSATFEGLRRATAGWTAHPLFHLDVPI
jgi:hypothetical protein